MRGFFYLVWTVIRLSNDMVMVFDGDGEQLHEYQGCYRDVRDKILADAPANSVFAHWFGYSREFTVVARQSW